MHEASVQLFEDYRQKYDGSVDKLINLAKSLSNKPIFNS